MELSITFGNYRYFFIVNFSKSLINFKIYALEWGQQDSSEVEVSPHNPRVVRLNLRRACDHFPELIISIPSDASHLNLIKPVSHASYAEAAISVHTSGKAGYT